MSSLAHKRKYDSKKCKVKEMVKKKREKKKGNVSVACNMLYSHSFRVSYLPNEFFLTNANDVWAYKINTL